MVDERVPVAVIGAGPAGLAVSAMLRSREISSVVLERSAVAASWRGHYDRLHLHTARWLSHLPGYRIPAAEGRWVSRDGVIRYLESYRSHHQLEVRTGVEIKRLDRDDTGWRLNSPQGDILADNVVVATGYNHTPLLPSWPGRADFGGRIIHASEYRNGEPFRDLDVLVVGVGNTGAEIAVDLAEQGARRIRLAVRRAPHILHRETMGIPSQIGGILLRHAPKWLSDSLSGVAGRLSMPSLAHKGLPGPEEGLFTRAARGEIPVQDVGLIDAILADKVEPVSAVESFTANQVVLADGTRIQPDAVIVAVGYERGLEPLVGHLGVLDANGCPRAHGPRTRQDTPGLYFLGYTNPISGMFREIALDSRRIASAISKQLGPARAVHEEGARQR